MVSPKAHKNSYLQWVLFSHHVAQVGFVSSVMFGVVLLSLNTFVTRRITGSYKHLMNIFTSLGIVFATMEIILYPNIHSYNAGFFYFSIERPFELSKQAVTIFLVVYKCFYCATTALISIQFIYRYWAVFNVSRLKYFRGRYNIIWLGYCLFFGVQYAYGAYLFLEVDEVATEYFREELDTHYNIIIEDSSALAYVAYDPKTYQVRWWNLMFTICITGVMSSQYVIMIYCGWSMHLKMETRIENFSPSLKQLHQQFFKTLILQITAPSLFLFIPIGFLIYLPLLDLDLSIPTGTIICAFSLYPAVDAIIVLSVVTDYRVSAKRLLRYWLKKLLACVTVSEGESSSANTRPSQLAKCEHHFN